MTPSSTQVRMRYGRRGMTLRVPASADILEPASPPPPLPDARRSIEAALDSPIGSQPFNALIARLLACRTRPRVAITISDITRPVPNRVFLPPMLDRLNRLGIVDEQVVIIVGTGLHRRSTPQEHAELVGPQVLARNIRIIDHDAHDPSTLKALEKLSGDDLAQSPTVRVCREFAEADFRIVTGFIEPHFMAGFSGGRKGVCPALVDLATVQAFHGYQTLAHNNAVAGRLDGNPCHDIALSIARRVGVDFLLNVALTPAKEVAAVYAGDLEAAHDAGCRDVARWTQVSVTQRYDLVITSGGGYPLDLTYYQTVKGMVAALPAIGPHSTLLVVSQCDEGLGSPAFTDLVLRYGRKWQNFLADASRPGSRVEHDQWQFQMQARVLERVGVERLLLAVDGIAADHRDRLAVTIPGGHGTPAADSAQATIDQFLARNSAARVAVIPDGPYTLLA